VTSSNRLLYWVPPDNRGGLQNDYKRTLPTTSALRITRIDFAKFQCGTEWEKVKSAEEE
jgi:hypothetical protein